MQDPRKLIVYQRGHALAVATRKAIGRFPASGYSELRDQMKKTISSIPFNIAEGCGADTPAEFARFLSISIKSSFELDAQLRLANDYEVMSKRTTDNLTKETEIVRRMLYKLRKRVLGQEN